MIHVSHEQLCDDMIHVYHDIINPHNTTMIRSIHTHIPLVFYNGFINMYHVHVPHRDKQTHREIDTHRDKQTHRDTCVNRHT